MFFFPRSCLRAKRRSVYCPERAGGELYGSVRHETETASLWKSVERQRLVVTIALLLIASVLSGCGGSSSTAGNQTATPTFSPGGGTYSKSQSVTVSDATAGAVLYCTTNGTTPTASSQPCAQPVTIYKSQYLQAIAIAPGKKASLVASAGYTIDLNAVATPTFSPGGGTYTAAQTVAIADATTGANIYYTVDGSVPTTSCTLYTAPIAVANRLTLNAIAAATGYSNSRVASASYTIQSLPTVAALSPSSVIAGGATFTLTVRGTNFAPDATVRWNGTSLATTYASAT